MRPLWAFMVCSRVNFYLYFGALPVFSTAYFCFLSLFFSLCSLRLFYSSLSPTYTLFSPLHVSSHTHHLPALYFHTVNFKGVHGIVGWGTMLQVRRSWVRIQIGSLGFFFDLILLTRLLTIEYQGCLLGVKAASVYGWQLCFIHVLTV